MNLPSSVTQLLKDWNQGSNSALNELMPRVHDTLRSLAEKYMRNERENHTLQATALVNEAYLRLVDADVDWECRAHFFAIAARTMRRILLDHAKARQRDKRGGDAMRVTLAESQIIDQQQQVDVLELDQALQTLAKTDARKAQVVELSFFGGMTHKEIAKALDISAVTVDRELRFSRAWLAEHLQTP